MATREMNVLVRNAFALTPPQVVSLQMPPTSEVLAGVAQKLAASASGGTPPYTWLWEQAGGSPATLGAPPPTPSRSRRARGRIP